MIESDTRAGDGSLPATDRAHPVAPCLPATDPLLADFVNRLHRLIAAAPGLRLLRGWHRREEPEAAFADDRGLLWRPCRAPRNLAECLDTQIDVLTDHETAIAAFERATGLEFTPVTIASDEAASARWIEVSHEDRRSAFGFLPHLWETVTLRKPAGEPAPQRTPIPVALSLRAGTVPLVQVETLAAGALLCLPAPPVMAALTAGAPAFSKAGSWNFESGVFLATPQSGAHSMTTSNAAAETGGLKVPLTIRLPETAVPATDIEVLAEGGTVTLTPLSEGLAAELLVGGQLIATGEIVRLGDAFAFLVDSMTAGPRSALSDAAFDSSPPVGGAQDEAQGW